MTDVVIGFDFGMKRIGVAVGQRVTGTATALAVLPAKNGIPDWQVIENLLKEWQPDLLVVGNPINMDGTASDMSRLSKKFANRLHGRFGVPCEQVDERLTTAKKATGGSTRSGNARQTYRLSGPGPESRRERKRMSRSV